MRCVISLLCLFMLSACGSNNNLYASSDSGWDSMSYSDAAPELNYDTMASISTGGIGIK